MRMDNDTRMIFSIIAGFFHSFFLSAAMRIGGLAVYYVSYLTKYDSNVTLFDGIMMQPIASFCLTCAVSLGGVLERKIGSQLTITLTAAISTAALSIMYFCSYHIAVGYIVMIMLGFGTGISFLLTIKNACLYKPEKKGLIASIIMTISQIGGPIFSVVGESIINPRSVIIHKDDWKFQPDISANYFNYLLFNFVLTVVGLALTLMCFIKYEDNQDVTSIDVEFIEEDSKSKEKSLRVDGKRSEKYKSDIRKILKSKRVYIIALIYFLSSFLYFLVMSTAKTIGSLRHFDTDLLKYSLMVGGIIICGFGPVWGYLYDKFHFKVLITVVNIAGVAIGVLMIFSLYNGWFFSLMTVVSGLFFVGTLNIFNPHAMKVFTIEYTMEIAGVLASAGGLSNILGSLFAFTISKLLPDESQAFYAYIVIYAVGSGFNLLSLIATRYESNDPFDFGEKEEERPNTSETSMDNIVDIGVDD